MTKCFYHFAKRTISYVFSLTFSSLQTKRRTKKRNGEQNNEIKKELSELCNYYKKPFFQFLLFVYFFLLPVFRSRDDIYLMSLFLWGFKDFCVGFMAEIFS